MRIPSAKFLRDTTALPLNIATKRSVTSQWGMKLGLALAGSITLWASAKLQVPFYPVPMTLQPLVLVMLGLLLGPVFGTAAVMIYLIEGALGLPVFAGTPEKGLGLAYMAGPTGGYLVGFLLCTLIAGTLATKGFARSFLSSGLCAVVAISTIYLPGITWLGYLIGLGEAIQFGLIPFVLGDAFKAFFAAGLTSMTLRYLDGK